MGQVMPLDGYIGISRGITDHWIYKDAYHFKIWFEMLYRARYIKEPKTDYVDGYLVTLEYGQFVFGRVSWSNRLKVGEQKLRTLIKKLSDDQMIEHVKDYPKFTIYLIKNYEKYNHQEFLHCGKYNHQEPLQNKSLEDDTNQQITSRQPADKPADNQQITTYKESNKDNKKDICAFFESIWNLYPNKKGKGQVSDTQKTKLFEIGLEELSRCIDRYRRSKEDWKAWQHGSTFFNSGYVDYLDKNYQEQAEETNTYRDMTNYEPGE
jgi:hypothetical protein